MLDQAKPTSAEFNLARLFSCLLFGITRVRIGLPGRGRE
jgi:hypothetical protein